jgi:hypothetical protein
MKIGQRVGISTYAHNNYYEILADLGIVGFVAYVVAVIGGFLLAFTGFGLSSPPVIEAFPDSEYFYSIIGNLI